MIGSHHIIVETKKIKYEFDIKRNITVIRGDSATGKTTLIDLLSQFARFQGRTGVKVESDVPCVVYADGLISWQEAIKSVSDSIIFIDEDYDFIKTKEFASIIKSTSNYYVLITRDYLKCLPYSVNEVYGIRNSGKYNFPQRVYNEFYPLYDDVENKKISAKCLIVEDSKSGYQFYSVAVPDISCISADGNSNIYKKLLSLDTKDGCYVIADGAAFGAFIDKILQLRDMGYKIGLILPESFEWFILKSNVVDINDLQKILETPEDYIDSRIYFSWERFFTELLEKGTSGSIAEYHKDELSQYYLEGKNREAILNTVKLFLEE